MELVEASTPRTPHGQEHGEWAKLLTSVDEGARNGNGFHGDWAKRGVISYYADGAVLLECAGYKTKRDEDAGRNRLFVLWEFRVDSWMEVARSSERDWALTFREQAQRSLDKS